MKWKTMTDALLGAVYPNRCIFCGEVLSSGESCCAECQAKVQPDPVWKNIAVREDYCVSCLGLYRYKGPVRKSILQLKFHDRKEIGASLGEILAKSGEVRRFCRECDLVIPVPISRRRKSERGYNQSLLIAQTLAERLNLPVSLALEKFRNNETQSALDRIERQRNVIGVYRVKKPEAISGKTILLVDDILTTGATLGACGLELYAAGAACVKAVTFAHAEVGDET